jgi:hypothetical protein
MGFESDLVARQVGDVDWELVEPLMYRGNTELFKVPIKTKTDFASVPAFFQWLIPRSGHLWRSVSGVSYKDADGIFRRAMAELKVPFLRRWLMWAAVRLRSLFKSAFRDGPRDLPRVLLLVLLPGLPIIIGGLLVVVLLLGFWVIESLVAVVLTVLRLPPAGRNRIKPTNRPSVLLSP